MDSVFCVPYCCVQWIYIVPALLFVMMSQSLSQNAAAQGAAE